MPTLWSKDLDKVLDVARAIRTNIGPMPMRIIRKSMTPPYLGHNEVVWEQA